MQRLWYLAHVAATTLAALLSPLFLKVTSWGELEPASRPILEWLTRFFMLQIFTALLLYVLLRSTKGCLNQALTVVAAVWAILMGIMVNFTGVVI
jgi:hypothetical protein